MSAADIAVALDVRPVEPNDRYARIMGAYEGLAPGETLELTVDHDPQCKGDARRRRVHLRLPGKRAGDLAGARQEDRRNGRNMMPSIQRPLSGDILVFDLGEERERAADPALLERSGRNARTLLKSGTLRVTLVVLDAGGELAEHQAEGPITVQPLQGSIRFTVKGEDHDLGPGEMLSAGPGVRHSVRSEEGGSFLLTVAHPESRDG